MLKIKMQCDVQPQHISLLPHFSLAGFQNTLSICNQLQHKLPEKKYVNVQEASDCAVIIS